MFIRELTIEEKCCGTSIEDGVGTMKYAVKDIKTTQKILQYEREHMNRTTMLKAIKSHLRRMGG